jgi:ParB family chromosome partitioning protein|tara:strand:+ start:25078 stop:26790 length:1713 start_codon:yes stop_codon:yes gene_type:complete
MEVQKEQTVQQFNISAIKPDPKQPRKTFNEKSLQLLADNIKVMGVLQPITVRPTAKGHIIVMGERRYRASKLAKLKTIPCIVRDFDSNIIAEVQIIENLQRQDVEPIEEAEAIAMLLEKYTAEEIATRIGRTVKFIYGRIKLANLIAGFRPFVRNKEMTLSMAITIAVFPEEDQKVFLEGMGENFKAHYISHALKNKMFDLKDAPFDLEDMKLIPKAGACTLCPFNSINQGSLFGDDKQICTKSSCFSSKKSKALHMTISQAKIESKLLVADFYRYQKESEGNQLIFSILKENGLIPFHMDDVYEMAEPIKPTIAEIRKENDWRKLTEKELEEELKGDLEQYEEELQEFKDAPSKGYKIGLKLDTRTYKTKEVLMIMVGKNTSEDKDKVIPLKKKKMEDCTPKEQVHKINAREDRKKHLEDNKQFEEVIKVVRETDYIDTKKALSVDEMVAFSIWMYQNEIGQYEGSRKFSGFFGKNNAISEARTVELFKKNFKKETFNKLVRMLLVKNVHFGESNHNNNRTNNAVYVALRGYCNKEMEPIETAYAEIRSAREKKLEARIAELEGKLEQQ